MKGLERIGWTPGTYLTPHHLQAQDDYFEDVLQFRTTASSTCNWGLTGIAIESLSDGMFSLCNCAGVFPDGLSFHIPDSDATPAERDFRPYFPSEQQNLDVYLVLPKRRSHGRNISLVQGDESTRYVAETRNIVDQTSGSDQKPVQICAKHFRILFGSESLDRTSSIRIAQITRSVTGAYTLGPDFIPPALSLEAGNHLLILLRGLIGVMAAKASILAAQRRQKGRSQAGFTSADVGTFWLLHTINSHLPELNHFWRHPRHHPEDLYTVMLKLAGALSSFALSEAARDLPNYDHDNLGSCFKALDNKIRDLLETAIPSRCVVVPLQFQQTCTWFGSIPGTENGHQTQFVLSVEATMGIADLIDKVPKLLKVSSSPAELLHLVRNALPGITLSHLPVPPDGIPVQLHRHYFALGVGQLRQVCLYAPDEITSPTFELLLVKS